MAANSYSGQSGTEFSVVRYGNVMGSRGSVILLFRLKTKNVITNEKMTRFMIGLEGVDLT